MMQGQPSSTRSSITAFGAGPRLATSPRQIIWSTPVRRISAMTACNATSFEWISEIKATRDIGTNLFGGGEDVGPGNGEQAFSEHWPRRAKRVFGETLDYYLMGLVDRIGTVEQIEIAAADHAVFDERAKIDDLLPVSRAEQHDRHAFLHLASLHQRQDLEQFVKRPETTWEQHYRLGEIDKPEFA